MIEIQKVIVNVSQETFEGVYNIVREVFTSLPPAGIIFEGWALRKYVEGYGYLPPRIYTNVVEPETIIVTPASARQVTVSPGRLTIDFGGSRNAAFQLLSSLYQAEEHGWVPREDLGLELDDVTVIATAAVTPHVASDFLRQEYDLLAADEDEMAERARGAEVHECENGSVDIHAQSADVADWIAARRYPGMWGARYLGPQASGLEAWKFISDVSQLAAGPSDQMEMTVDQAAGYSAEVGEPVAARSIRLAARRGDIPGARKVGRDWLIPYAGFNRFLDNRPRRGPKSA